MCQTAVTKIRLELNQLPQVKVRTLHMQEVHNVKTEASLLLRRSHFAFTQS